MEVSDPIMGLAVEPVAEGAVGNSTGGVIGGSEGGVSLSSKLRMASVRLKIFPETYI